ncbi:hypothetical protein F3Y22_tig00110432pilonHSYRG00095 [Hibiscus syriacus]|uniref:Uncharacterized protein n=1 Tax=Hibiscus syriacus TaxID=106335 RepID=A0A6A3APW1_HIBSY|nr:hypothetical protein F3Y22_tig00110432pilonHSYRG00095 [Hibiscus syriacus]
MSSVMEFAASKESNEEGRNERLDHLLNMDPTLSNSFSLSADTFLKAAISLKNQDLSLAAEIVDACVPVDVAQEKALPVGPEEGGFGMSYDLLHGRAGFLWAALFLNKHLRDETVPNDVLMPIVDAILAAANGLAGICTCSFISLPRKMMRTLRYMMIVKVYPNDREFRDPTIEAGEVVWKNGLVKKVGLADGDHGYSLFQGLGGIACLWFDLLAPHSSKFPGY